MLRQHAKVKERDARSVKMSERFSKLPIAPDSAALEHVAVGPAEEPEPERARRSDTHTFNRLLGRDGEGQRPPTVVLQGPAGIGKTMAARKILYDWAAGKGAGATAHVQPGRPDPGPVPRPQRAGAADASAVHTAAVHSGRRGRIAGARARRGRALHRPP